MDKLLLEKIRKAYTMRLLEALKEVDMVDKAGNVLISKDLKVFHKDSGYEYTVDDVLKTPDGIKVVLRPPEEPRFEPEAATTLIDEVVDDPDVALEEFNDDSSDLFIVDEDAFEREYEVK